MTLDGPEDGASEELALIALRALEAARTMA